MGLLEQIFGDVDFFNPNHVPAGSERGGQFASKKGGAAAVASFDAQSKIEGREREIAKIVDREVMYAIMPNGREVKIDGERDRVNLPTDDLQAGKWEGAIVTHNHPVTGHSFTPEDVYVAQVGKFAEMRAVATTGDGKAVRYRIKPTPSFFKTTIRQMVASESAKLYYENKAKIDKGKMTQAEAERTHFDTLWRRLDKTLGLNYSVEEFDA